MSQKLLQTVQKYWMQPKNLQAFDAALLPVKKKFSSAINYYKKAKMNAGIHAAKMDESVGCRQNLSSIWCRNNFYIHSVSSFCNYCSKGKIIQQKLVINWTLVICAPAFNLALEILDCIQKYFLLPCSYVWAILLLLIVLARLDRGLLLVSAWSGRGAV